MMSSWMSCFRSENGKLISRYKESRRAHPLNEQGQRSLIEAINEERKHLSEIRSIANYVIDTTQLKPKELKERISKFYLDDHFETFSINVTSFGFKHGIQMDADLVFDVRFYLIHIMLKNYVH